MEKDKQVSIKSTKNELLDAYNELLAKVKEEKPEDRKIDKQKAGEDKLLETASQNSIDKIIKELSETKLAISRSLDELGEKLVSEYKNFTDLQNAIIIEENYLEEIYQIKVNADSLAALLRAQKEKKIEFEAEISNQKELFEQDMNQKRQIWKTEQETYEVSKKERELQAKKDRQREEEDYNYNLQLSRKKEKDIFEEKKAILEKQLSDRESAILLKEKEYSELKIRVDSFNTDLQKAVEEAKKAITLELETKYRYQTELINKDLEGERKLSKQIITSLENKIKEQDNQIKKLSERTDESIEQVHSIAIKAVEGSQKNFSAINIDKTAETIKN